MSQRLPPLAIEEFLAEKLHRIDASHLRRRLRRIDSPQGPEVVIDGRRVINFSSNDYLGLANEPFLVEEFQRAVRDFGTGSGASRSISGTLAPHIRLEETLASFKNLPAALATGSGHATAVGVIPAMVGPGDVVILDKLAHACLIDGARLSGATMRIFRHNDIGRLEELLLWASRKHPSARVLIATESVFSMDGDIAPLEEIVNLKERHGAWLMLDEAHGLGVLGEDGRGLAHALDLHERIEIHMGTLGKAVGVSGGYIAGSRNLVDFLINSCRSFIFSTAPPAAQAAAARASLDWIAGPAGRKRIAALAGNRTHLRDLCPEILPGIPPTAIVPIPVGDEARAMQFAARSLDAGVFIPAVRFPTVSKGRARLRLTLTATHTAEHLEAAAKALRMSA